MRRPIDQFLRDQQDLVANWQLADAGVPASTIKRQVAGFRTIFAGVHASGYAPLTPWQLGKAASLTTRDSSLSAWHLLALAGLDWNHRGPVDVIRPGSGGRRTCRRPGPNGHRLNVRHSQTLDDDLTAWHGIPALSFARVVRDLLPGLPVERRERLVREVLRLGLASDIELWAQIAAHRGERGVAILNGLTKIYAPLQFGRERSDAEALARALLEAANVGGFRINEVIAGHEADLSRRGLILELDGPQFHQFLIHDARIQAGWERAGWVVRRLPTGDVYDEPHRLIRAARTPLLPHELERIALTTTADDILARWSEHGRYEWSDRQR